MADFNFPEEDFDRYTIGFTENQYHGADTLSPPPSDNNRGYNSPALDYAERSNRGEARSFQDHSSSLDKRKSRSVSKIHANILDLMFELTERRKGATPPSSRSLTMGDFHRADSRSSDYSIGSQKTSSSMPIIEVQQLPPRSQLIGSCPDVSPDFYGLPNSNNTFTKTKSVKKVKKKNSKTKQTNSKKTTQYDSLQTTSKPSSKPKILKVVDDLLQNTRNEVKKPDTHTKGSDNKDAKETNVKCSIGEAKHDKSNDHDQLGAVKPPNKFKLMTQRLVEAHKLVKDSSALSDVQRKYVYRSRSSTSSSSKGKLSFCQSSYQERTEKKRVTNVQRRHQSQTNTGPLDFNKLRRQITVGRSKTIVC